MKKFTLYSWIYSAAQLRAKTHELLTVNQKLAEARMFYGMTNEQMSKEEIIRHGSRFDVFYL